MVAGSCPDNDEVEKKVRITVLTVLCAIVGMSLLGPAATPASARPSQGVNWGQHDTAVYVVSTLNLLRTKKGNPMVNVMKRQLGVDHYNVYVSETPGVVSDRWIQL